MRWPRWPAASKPHGFLDGLAEPGPHEPGISDLFEGRMAPEPDQHLDCPLTVMAFTNRCGSNLLADYLLQTGRFGGFGEALNLPVAQAFRDRQGTRSLPGYLGALAETHLCNRERSLGVKASADQLAMLIRHGIPRMFAGFRVVHIWRQDLVGQAVSFAIADQTKSWTSRQEPTGRSDGRIAVAPAQIEQMIQAIQQQNNRIAAILATLGIGGPTVSYEELTANPAQAMRRVCTMLGVELGAWEPRAPRIEKQADALNERLVAEYRALARARLAP